MIDQELKKKIVNTISQYEHKCDKMQNQINTLRNVINQLIINPIGINYELDDRLSQLRNYLDTEFEPAVIEKSETFGRNTFQNAKEKSGKFSFSQWTNQTGRGIHWSYCQ